TSDFFHARSAAATLRRRESGERIAGQLGVQGLAAIESSGGPDAVELSLLAARSAQPETLSFNLSDPASYPGALPAPAGDVPPIRRRSVDMLVVDVAAVRGAVVIDTRGASGFTAGDVITEIAGAPVTSATDLTAKLTGPAERPVPATVRSPNGVTRSVSI